MYYAMYGEYSNGDKKYFVNRCASEDSGEEKCMCNLMDYENEAWQLEYYTCINGMPDELDSKYNADGENIFIDGVLARYRVNLSPGHMEDEYEVVTCL